MDRERRKLQEDYKKLEDQVKSLEDQTLSIKQQMSDIELSSPVDESPISQAKNVLIEIMKIEGVEGYEHEGYSLSAKYSEKRKVNGRRLLEAIGGDIDLFMSIVKPTQKAVKDFASDRADIKKEVL